MVRGCPRRVHEQPAAQAALSQPPEEPGTRAAQAGYEAGLAAAPALQSGPGGQRAAGKRR